MFPAGSGTTEQYIIMSSLPSLTVQCLVHSWHSDSVERMSQLNNEFDYQNVCRQRKLLLWVERVLELGHQCVVE